MKHICERIIAFYKKFKYEKDFIYKSIQSIIIDEDKYNVYIIILDSHNHNVLYCNHYINLFIFTTIYKLTYKSEEGKLIFLALLTDILINNEKNIRYDFTIKLIYTNPLDYYDIINFLKEHGLIYLLSRINPNKLYDNYLGNKKFKERAEYIYDIKLELQSAWLAAVAKAALI